MRISKGSWCSAVNCGNNRGRNPNLSFFRFPKDPFRAQQWVINCQRKDLHNKDVEYLNSNCRLCSLHFEDNQFMNTEKKSLVHDAVPTLFKIIKDSSGQILDKRKAPLVEENSLKMTEKDSDLKVGRNSSDTNQVKTKEDLEKEVRKLESMCERKDAIIKNLRIKLQSRQFRIRELRIKYGYLHRKLDRLCYKKSSKRL